MGDGLRQRSKAKLKTKRKRNSFRFFFGSMDIFRLVNGGKGGNYMRHPTVLEMFITNIATENHESLKTQNWSACESSSSAWLMTEDHTGAIVLTPCLDYDNAWVVEYMINDKYADALFDYRRDLGRPIKVDGAIVEEITEAIRHRIDQMRRK